MASKIKPEQVLLNNVLTVGMLKRHLDSLDDDMPVASYLPEAGGYYGIEAVKLRDAHIPIRYIYKSGRSRSDVETRLAFCLE
jgi:hypothetical protein